MDFRMMNKNLQLNVANPSIAAQKRNRTSLTMNHSTATPNDQYIRVEKWNENSKTWYTIPPEQIHKLKYSEPPEQGSGEKFKQATTSRYQPKSVDIDRNHPQALEDWVSPSKLTLRRTASVYSGVGVPQMMPTIPKVPLLSSVSTTFTKKTKSSRNLTEEMYYIREIQKYPIERALMLLKICPSLTAKELYCVMESSVFRGIISKSTFDENDVETLKKLSIHIKLLGTTELFSPQMTGKRKALFRRKLYNSRNKSDEKQTDKKTFDEKKLDARKQAYPHDESCDDDGLQQKI